MNGMECNGTSCGYTSPEKMDMERMMKMQLQLVERTLRCTGRRGKTSSDSMTTRVAGGKVTNV